MIGGWIPKDTFGFYHMLIGKIPSTIYHYSQIIKTHKIFI